MKRFKEYLKQLAEDKIIAKEDEGAVAPVGDVSAPPSDGSQSSGDIQTSEPKKDGSLSTTDILGKCDHKHDGFFGPGCMHRPFPVFSYPISRIKKKKRKYIKVLDLTESDEFNNFNKKARDIILQEIFDANIFLKKLDLECFYGIGYNFSGEKQNWVGATDFENQDDIHRIGIAFNLPVIYEFLEENSLENDETELRCQIKATLYHELGHAIVQKFRDDEIYDFEMTDGDEEKLVEEFSNYMMREYTGKSSSRLNDFINEVFGENLNEYELNETDSIKRGNFFVNPININHPKRKIASTIIKTGKFGKVLPNFKNVLVKADENIFSGQKRDYLVSLSNNGYLSLTFKPEEQEDKKQKEEFDEETKKFLDLPDNLKNMCLQIISFPESSIYNRMSEEGKFPSELEDIWMNALDMNDDKRQETIEKLKNAQERSDTAKKDAEEKKNNEGNVICLRPTVADLIRIFHGKKETLPLDLLTMIDNREHDLDYRYDEGENDPNTFKDLISEETLSDNRKELCNAVLARDKRDGKYSKGRPERWALMTNQLGNNLQNYQNLGKLVYMIGTTIHDPNSGDYQATDYVFSKANLIGMKTVPTRNGGEIDINTTFTYMEPTEIIKDLRNSKSGVNETVILYGNENVDDIPMDLLWEALLNVANNRSFAGSKRGTAQGRAEDNLRHQ